MNKDCIGSDFDDFLKEECILGEVTLCALMRVLNYLTSLL